MFDLFRAQELEVIRDVAAILGVTVAHVYVAKHRLAKLIKKEAAFLEERGA